MTPGLAWDLGTQQVHWGEGAQMCVMSAHRVTQTWQGTTLQGRLCGRHFSFFVGAMGMCTVAVGTALLDKL